MRILILSLLLITGCATQTKAPDWAIAELPASEIATPDPLPKLCEMVVVNNAIDWSPECWQRLVEYELIAKSNTEIATHNTSALRATESAYSALHAAGTMQQQMTTYYADLLRDERQGRFWDGIIYKALIGLGLVVLP